MSSKYGPATAVSESRYGPAVSVDQEPVPAPDYQQNIANIPGTYQQIPRPVLQFAQSVNIGIPALLDLPSHVVNWIAEKAGSDFRIPATMVDNWNNKMFGEGNAPNYMEPGWGRELVDAAGTATGFAMGATPVARAPGVASLGADIAGLGSTTTAAAGRASAPALGGAFDPDQMSNIPVVRQAQDNIPIVSKARQAREAGEEAVMRGEGDIEAAGYRYDPRKERVTPDKAGREVLRQGFEPGTTALIKSSTVSGKQRMIDMLEMLKRTRKNKRVGVYNRPSDIAGQSLEARVKAVRNANRRAGEQINEVAKNTLKNRYVDFRPAVNGFLGDLKELGIKYNPDTKVLDFSESAIRGLTGIEKAVRRVISQMEGTGMPDAFDIHELKRILDEQVTYGKSKGGLTGRVVGIVKDLRHELDSILDANFPKYNEVNTQYSETINALDEFQKAVGSTVRLTGGNADKALGREARKLLSNYKSREPFMDGLAELERLAKKYGTSESKDIIPYRGGVIGDAVDQVDLDDDLTAQVMFLSELESNFGSYAPNSFQGIQEKVAERAARLLEAQGQRGLPRMAWDAWAERNKGEDQLIEALEKMLKEKDLPAP